MNRLDRSECTNSYDFSVREVEGKNFNLFDLQKGQIEQSKLRQGEICWPSL